ncbi:hypothetical protein L593_14370 [Salinarchaeum sp. Harcht-Bsk1]|uniref:hypothetical protein n=1 Tax=Salinarchaeum sp. Harcht-Bsk1 TaxID=1333523 RepID=UPI00034230DB|nr:hypothetical protein [Salinarchaeum sp. Harcht-Bsk1]AGN02813.1 hypothetical protein L593_14370 [Salinarchaeum sp. Harcht-Bsk1]
MQGSLLCDDEAQELLKERDIDITSGQKHDLQDIRNDAQTLNYKLYELESLGIADTQVKLLASDAFENLRKGEREILQTEKKPFWRPLLAIGLKILLVFEKILRLLGLLER